MICSPMVITGFSENFGSCMTIEIRCPRTAASRARFCHQFDAFQSNPIGVDMPGGRIKRRMARPVIDLPEPLSPTMPSRSAQGEGHTPHRFKHALAGGKSYPKVFDIQQASFFAILRVKHIAQPVAQQVERQRDGENRQSGHGRNPPVIKDELRPSKSSPPIPGLGLRAKAKEPKPGAARDDPAISSVTRTIRDEMHSGQMCLVIIRSAPAPCS